MTSVDFTTDDDTSGVCKTSNECGNQGLENNTELRMRIELHIWNISSFDTQVSRQSSISTLNRSMPRLNINLLLTPTLQLIFRPARKPIQTPLPLPTIHLADTRHRQPPRLPRRKLLPPKRLRRTRIMTQIYHCHAPKLILRGLRILITLKARLTQILRTYVIDHDDNRRRTDCSSHAIVAVDIAAILEFPARAALAR